MGVTLIKEWTLRGPPGKWPSDGSVTVRSTPHGVALSVSNPCYLSKSTVNELRQILQMASLELKEEE